MLRLRRSSTTVRVTADWDEYYDRNAYVRRRIVDCARRGFAARNYYYSTLRAFEPTVLRAPLTPVGDVEHHYYSDSDSSAGVAIADLHPLTPVEYVTSLFDVFFHARDFQHALLSCLNNTELVRLRRTTQVVNVSTDWLAYGDQTDRLRRRILYCARHRFAWSNHLHVRRSRQLTEPGAFPRLGYTWRFPRPRSAPAVPAVVMTPALADEPGPTFVQVFFDWMFWFQPSLTTCLGVRETRCLFCTAHMGSFRQPRPPRMLRAAPVILPIAIVPERDPNAPRADVL
jgi:hypothetical protein